MDIIFLDQNKWIDLARIHTGKDKAPTRQALLEELKAAVTNGKVIFPLTVAHILETSKRNDPKSRAHLAEVQTALSKGYVFRSRKARLLLEMRSALKRLFSEPEIELPQHWAIVPGFMQAFEHFDEMGAQPNEAKRTRFLNQHIDPKVQLYDYLVGQDDTSRRAAHQMYASESDALVTRIEDRRKLWSTVTPAVRERAYAARLFFDHQGYVAHELEAIGHSVDEMKALGGSALIQFMAEVPTFAIEVALSVSLEKQSRPIHANDIRDMHSFCSAIPYALRLIAENTFVTLALQSKLDSRYGCNISTKLDDLSGLYI